MSTEKRLIRLYGSLAGILSIDYLPDVGPRGAGLVICEVDDHPGIPKVIFALDPGGADQAAGALEGMRRKSDAARMAGNLQAADPDAEFAVLHERGLSRVPLQAAFDAGRLGTTPASHLVRESER